MLLCRRPTTTRFARQRARAWRSCAPRLRLPQLNPTSPPFWLHSSSASRTSRGRAATRPARRPVSRCLRIQSPRRRNLKSCTACGSSTCGTTCRASARTWPWRWAAWRRRCRATRCPASRRGLSAILCFCPCACACTPTFCLVCLLGFVAIGHLLVSQSRFVHRGRLTDALHALR